MTSGRIGVVTVTFNSADVVSDFLRCLLVQTQKDFVLFAIDNASQDHTVDILHSCKDPRVIIVTNPDNRGVAEGNNQGIRKALESGCTSILLLNNDTEFGETLLSVLEEGLYEYGCDMICPKILYFDEPDRIWAAGGFFQPRLGYRALHYGDGETDQGQFDEVRQVTYTPTCCVLVRSELFEKIGLMDARYFAYVDDTDFMYRALKARRSLFYTPKVRLFHKVGRLTGGKHSAFSIKYGARNHAFFSLKHFGPVTARFLIFTHRLYYLANLLRGKDSYATFRMKQNAINEAYRMPKADVQV